MPHPQRTQKLRAAESQSHVPLLILVHPHPPTHLLFQDGNGCAPTAYPRWISRGSFQPARSSTSPSAGGAGLCRTRHQPARALCPQRQQLPQHCECFRVGVGQVPNTLPRGLLHTGPSILPDAREAAIETADQESRFNAAFMVGNGGKKKKKERKRERKMMLLPGHLHVHFSRECDTLSFFSN